MGKLALASIMAARPVSLAALAALAGLAVAGCGSSAKCGPEPATPAAAPSGAPAAQGGGAGAPGGAGASGFVTAPLPAVSAAPEAILRVEVAKDGALSIEGVRLGDPRELTERARASLRNRPDLGVVIAADKDAPYAYVMNAMDLVKQASVTKIAFAVEKGAPPPAVAPPQGSVPTLKPGDKWKCHFAGHIEHLENVSVFVAIHVGPDGKPQTVDVLEDPGPGLGDAARLCAMRHEFLPATDGRGTPVAGVMKLRVYFQHGKE